MTVDVPVRKRSPYATLSQVLLPALVPFWLSSSRQEPNIQQISPSDVQWDVMGGGNTDNGIRCSRGRRYDGK